MKTRKIKDRIYWMGSVDWDRRLFDDLVPLPDGTSYNAYLMEGSEKTVLLDSVDPTMADELMAQLEGVSKVDYIISHHTEQDHSGTIPQILEKYTEARLISTPKAKGMLIDHLHIPEELFITVKDEEVLSLGDKTLKFIYAPWVHRPETMVTYLEEDKILFSCDFFGSHIAATDLYATDEGRVYEAAKRYFAEIMRIEHITGNQIVTSGLDVFDGTPLLDIKPYIKELDTKPDANYGWLEDLDDRDHLMLHIKGIPHDY